MSRTQPRERKGFEVTQILRDIDLEQEIISAILVSCCCHKLTKIYHLNNTILLPYNSVGG
jgi:hypothetical protein